MSSALIRQALDFVDQDGLSRDKRSKRKSVPQKLGQEHRLRKNISKKRKQPKLTDQSADNIKKLLELSKPVADNSITDKIVERAVKGRPLVEFIEVKKQEQEKSILFPDEPYEDFEKELFCR